jgi:predicted RNase H-like nuclease (RuvC/YqgF family)
MISFIQKQIDSSERLYKMMLDDHANRVKSVTYVYEVSESLQKKLNERDLEIEKLRNKLRAYESIERM